MLQDIEVEFNAALPALFGVPAFVPALMDDVKRYGIDLCFESKLAAINGEARFATFERKGADGATKKVERSFDMLHAVPPQCAPECVARSALSNESGRLPVDPTTLRHERFPNVFGLGDVIGTTQRQDRGRRAKAGARPDRHCPCDPRRQGADPWF